jgi:hypothetical protein
MRHSASDRRRSPPALEPASLAILLLNLAFGNAPSIAAAVGPIHGCLYLFVIIATARDPPDDGRGSPHCPSCPASAACSR